MQCLDLSDEENCCKYLNVDSEIQAENYKLFYFQYNAPKMSSNAAFRRNVFRNDHDATKISTVPMKKTNLIAVCGQFA